MLKQQNSDGGKIHKGQEGSIRLVISGGDSAKPLDFLEKTLHQMGDNPNLCVLCYSKVVTVVANKI